MRKPEQLFYDNIRRYQLKFARDFWMQRVENAVGDGFPDVFISYKDIDPVTGYIIPRNTFWVELKQVQMPKRMTSRLFSKNDIRISQVNWHKKFASMGGASHIMAKVGTELFLFPGSHAEHLENYDVDTAINHGHQYADLKHIFDFWRNKY